MARPRATSGRGIQDRGLGVRNTRRIVVLGSYIVLGAWALMSLYPYLWVLFAAFKTQAEIFAEGGAVLPSSVNTDNFQRILDDGFARYLLNTVIVSVGASVLVVVAASMAAYALAKLRFRGRSGIMGGVVLLLFLPPTLNVIPIVSIVRTLGLLDSYLGMILVLAAFGMVVSILLFYGYFRSLPPELDEAAIIDGASAFQVYRHIVMPIARPMILTVGLLQLVGSWNNIVIPLVLTLGKPDLRTLAVGLYAYRGEHLTNWALISAGAAIAIIPVLLVFFAAQRYFVEGISGSVK